MKKRVIAVVTAVVIVLSVVFCIPAVASGTNDVLSVLVDTVCDEIAGGNYSQEQIILDYYDTWYYFLVNNEYQVSSEMLDTSTGTISDEYLADYEYYYNQFNLFSNPIDWDYFGQYAKARYLEENAGEEVSPATNSIVTEAQDTPKISGKSFTEICAQLSEQYAPEASSGRFSWKDDYRCTSNGVAFGRFYSEGEFLNGKSLDLYLIPFYDDGEHVYFPLSQYHFSQKTTFNDSGGLSSLMIYYKLITSTDHTAITEDVAFLNSLAYRYADLGFGVYRNGSSAFGPYMAHYDSYSNYVNIKPISAGNMAYISYTDYYSDYMRYFYYDLNETPIDHYTEMVYYNADPSTVTTDIDFGFYYSDKPITMQIIEPVTFEDDDVVTLTGDNIYDYTITNNQGDTTTINYYINNNYTYPETDSGEDDSSGTGGTVGGDVTVSGDIGVNGSVDVNVNVNSDSGSGSMPVDVDLDNYFENVPELAKPVTDFISIFFDFLPPELFSLICLGVVVATVLRIWGR